MSFLWSRTPDDIIRLPFRSFHFAFQSFLGDRFLQTREGAYRVGLEGLLIILMPACDAVEERSFMRGGIR